MFQEFALKNSKAYLQTILLLFFTLGLLFSAAPAEAEPGDRIVEVYPLSSHTFALTETGSVWAWGDNQHGKLGDGTTTSRAIPIQPLLENVKELHPQSSGHTFALKNDGTLWAWERNWDGRLGTGQEDNHYPTPVQILDNVAKLFPGDRHSFALKNDGTLWGWGKNSHGQLGDGTTVSRFEPAQVDLGNVSSVYPGYNHSFAILNDHSLWAWGNNQYGKLGDGATSSRHQPVKVLEDVKTVYPQTNHTIAHKNDQTVWSWGHNWYGQLGLNSGDNHPEPGQLNLAQVEEIFSQENHTFALKEDGSLWSWGHNWYGQLGDGSITNRQQPVQVPVANVAELYPQDNHTFVLQEDHTLWGWGHNWDGRIGDNSSSHIRPAPVKIAENIKSTYPLEKHAFALDSNNTPLAWGDNSKGQLGNGFSPEASNPHNIDLQDVKTIFPQDNHTFALKKDGSLWAWGDNSKGQLGVGNYQRQDNPVQVLLGEDLPTHTISLSANPQEGGVLSGGGQYRHGQSVNLSASAVPGYSFINWTEKGEEISSNHDFSFLATGDRELVANFKAPSGEESPRDAAEPPIEEEAVQEEPEEFTVTLAVKPEEAGIVEGSGTYKEDSEVQISAKAEEGYRFLNWTELISHNGLDENNSETDIEVIVTEDSDYSFNITRNLALTANFEAVETELPSPGIEQISAENGLIKITFDRDLEEKPALEDFKARYLVEVISPEDQEPMGGIDQDFRTGGPEFYNLDFNDEDSENQSAFFEFADEEQDSSFYDYETDNQPAEDQNNQDHNEGTAGENINDNDEENPAGNEPNEQVTEGDVQNGAESTDDIEPEDVEEEDSQDNDLTDEEADSNNWQALTLSELKWDEEQASTVLLGFEPFKAAEKDTSYLIELSYLDGDALTAKPFVVEAETFTYNLDLIVEPENAGSAEGSGRYEESEAVPVTTTANEGYSFISWVIDDQVVSEEKEFTYIMPDQDITLTAVYEEKPEPQYELTLDTKPEEGGSAEGAGFYKADETVIITAEAFEGYEFINWTLAEEVISTDQEFNYTMPGQDVSLAANFHKVPETFQISLISEPEEAGILNGAGRYEQGLEVTVTAEANDGFEFINWTASHQVVSENKEFTFIVEQNRELTANFEELEEELPETQIDTVEAENGLITLGFNTELDSSPEIDQFKALVFTSEGSEETEAGEADSEQDENHADRWQELQLTDLNWDQEQADQVSLSFKPFTAAEQDISYSIKTGYLDGDKVAAEPFIVEAETPLYSLTLETKPREIGVLEGAGDYQEGEAITVSAAVNEDYEFINWTNEEVIIAIEKEFAYVMPAEEITLTANFTAIPETFNINLSVEPQQGGSVEGGGTYEQNEDVTVKAIADEGFSFISWTEKTQVVEYFDELDEEITSETITVVSESNNYSFTTEENRSLTANFEAIEEEPELYNLDLEKSPEGSGTLEGSGQYEKDETVDLSAEANEGYDFEHWLIDDAVLSSENNYSYSMQEDDTVLRAVFVEIPTYNLTVEADPGEGGTISGAGHYEAGEEALLEAEPAEGYTFAGWFRNEEKLSASKDYPYIMPEQNLTLTASFELELEPAEIIEEDFFEPMGSSMEEDLFNYSSSTRKENTDIYYLELIAQPGYRGEVTGEGFYELGEKAVAIAEPEPNYVFYAWTRDDETISYDQKYEFEIDEDLSLKAVFELEEQSYYISLSSNPGHGGSLQGEGLYLESETALVKAISTEHYAFTGWSEKGNFVSFDPEYNFEVTADRDLVANYTLQPTEPEPDELSDNSSHEQEPEGQIETNSLKTLHDDEPAAASTYTIDLLVEPINLGTVTGSGEYEAGKLVGLNAEPRLGYYFTGWYEKVDHLSDNEAGNDETEASELESEENEDSKEEKEEEDKYVLISKAKQYAFEASRDRILTARFEPLEHRQNEKPETFEIKLSPRPRLGGQIYGSGDYTEGEKVTVTALADLEFIFVNWTMDGEIVSTDIIYTFHIEHDMDLVANFEPIGDSYFIEPTSNSYHERDPSLDSYLSEDEQLETFSGQEYSLQSEPSFIYPWILPQGDSPEQ